MGIEDYGQGKRPAAIIGQRWCPKCGRDFEFNPWVLDIAKRTGSRLNCPYCEKPSKLGQWLDRAPEVLDVSEAEVSEEKDEMVERDGMEDE